MADTSRGFQPYVPASQSMAEFTAKAIFIGVLFGLLFGASTVYLGLRAGLTVSASIPIAVLAISVLKHLGGSTILENNIVQTIGSAGELNWRCEVLNRSICSSAEAWVSSPTSWTGAEDFCLPVPL